MATSVTPMILEVELPHEAAAPGLARRAIDDFLMDRCAPEVTEAVLMAASELVTNAVRHTSGPCQLTVRILDTEIMVEVRDNGATLTDRTYLGDDLLGRGLGMVQSIAHRWGIERHPEGGKIVWAEISIVADGIDV